MYEDVRLNVKDKTVHSKAHSFFHDLKEPLDNKEIMIRTNLRGNTALYGFSIYWRALESGKNHMSIVENHNESPTTSWSAWFRSYLARRDAYCYLRNRWFAH